ncbi:MAG: hypothetical protein R3293_05305 [Candidatus Promineifilaceae bacterium]|nr:hypothetical protein [Candidatus Promineifilaceae bacterium]
MLAERISAKFIVTNPDVIDLPAIIPIFHRWIQEHAVDDVLIDVVDYKHVPQGPGILLVGHNGVYSLDMANGQPGLRYRQNRGWPVDTTAGRLRHVIHKALEGAQLLELSPELSGAVSFGTSEIELSFFDRLNAPNDPTSFSILKPELERISQLLYETADVEIKLSSSDPRRPLTVNISSPTAPTLPQLLGNLIVVAG